MKINDVIVVPMCGFVPGSHMGHALDLMRLTNHVIPSCLNKQEVKTIIGISEERKTSWTWDSFMPNMRADIFRKQIYQACIMENLKEVNPENVLTPYVKTVGETLRLAYQQVASEPDRHLHLIVGRDRVDMAQTLLRSVLKTPEAHGLPTRAFTFISISWPYLKRYKNFSGTMMRQACADEDYSLFDEMIGDGVDLNSKNMAYEITVSAIKHGLLKIKR